MHTNIYLGKGRRETRGMGVIGEIILNDIISKLIVKFLEWILLIHLLVHWRTVVTTIMNLLVQ